MSAVTGRTLPGWMRIGLGALFVGPAVRAQGAAPGPQPSPWSVVKGTTVPGVAHQTFPSRVVGAEVGFNVWWPPGYAAGTARHPVLYFLPGSGGNEHTGVSVVLRAVQESVAKRILPPVICVFCNPGAGTFRDNRVPGVLGETMFITEFVPMIDAKFRTVASRDGRALLGFSMGGSGTLRFVLGHPDVFESGVSLGSPRLRDEEPAMSRLDQVKQAGSAVMIVMGSKEAATSRELAPPFVRGLAAQGVSVSLITPEGVPHNLDLYLTASWAEVAAFFGGHLRGPVAP